MTTDASRAQWHKADLAVLVAVLVPAFGAPMLLSLAVGELPLAVRSGLTVWPHSVTAGTALALAARRGRPSDLLGARLSVRWRPVIAGWLLSYGLALCYGLFLVLPLYLLLVRARGGSPALPPDALDVSTAVAFAEAGLLVIGAPTSEEIFFRGALFTDSPSSLAIGKRPS